MDCLKSPQHYFLYTNGKHESMGPTQLIVNPCVFISTGVICLLYVDHILLFDKNKLAMENWKITMNNDMMLFWEENSVASYLDLGAHIDCQKDSTIHWTQRGLTQFIVKAFYLKDNSVKLVDTSYTKYLPINEEG